MLPQSSGRRLRERSRGVREDPSHHQTHRRGQGRDGRWDAGAAENRVEGILGNSRRRHYGQAALLVAACVATAPAGRGGELTKWALDLRQQYWRRHAFRQEFAKACERLNVSLPA